MIERRRGKMKEKKQKRKTKSKNGAIFLDRDGTINVDKSYVYRLEDFEFISGSLNALQLLSKTQYKLIIVTNQSGIGLGLYTQADYNKVTNYMLAEFKKHKIRVDKIYFCSHSPEKRCNCRKPQQQMIKNAQNEFNIDLKNSFVIGDKTSDIEFGKRAGCKTILLETGLAGKDGRFRVKPDFVCKNLLEAAKLIIRKN